MARAVRFDLIADSSRFTRGMRDAQRSTDGFQKHTSAAGTALKGLFATFSAGVVIAGLKSTVDAASNLNETMSKTRVVFGPAAKQVEDFAKRAATSLGLSRQEAQESAATFGNLFVSMRIGAPRAAEMSTRMIQLASDLASFNNANPAETLEALRSGLVGETEPLRRFGINLNDADLRQKALSLGLVKTTKDVLPPAIKAQAAYALILEQSKTAQGDFARTSDGLANQQRILAANIKDLKANIGQALLPAVLNGVSAFNSFLGVVERNRKAFGVLFGVIAAGAAAIGGLLLIERTVKATQEAIKVATTGWAAAQKGLNVVLGVTRVQAATTAVATDALATSTAAAGTAAGGAASKFALLRGAAGLGLLGGAAIVLGVAFVKLKDSLKDAAAENEKYGRTAVVGGKGGQLFAQRVTELDAANRAGSDAAKKHAEATQDQALQTAFAAKQTEAQRLEMVKAIPQFQTSADKIALNAEKAKELGGKLADLRKQFHSTVDSVKESIQSYDGLISKSKVTAGQVIRDLKTQTANFKTYSADVQRLIKAGVDPKAIEELSQKGPQFIHALATGSKTQLANYKKAWVDRNREIRGDFADSMEKQLQALVRKIKAMQRQIDSLTGKNIPITASLKLNFSSSFTQQDWVQVRLAAGRMASGGLVSGPGGPTADMVPALLSDGEFVVNAKAVREIGVDNMKRLNAMEFARGGPVGQIDTQTRAINKVQAWGTGRRMDAGISKIMSLFSARPPHVPGGWQFALKFLRQLGIAFNVISTFRPGARTHASGAVSFHALNRAVDLDGNKMAIFNALARTNPTELIYSRASRYKSRSGWHPIGRLDPITRADHFSHVHAAYDKGGWLRPGWTAAYNGTGRSEPVGFDYDKLAAAIVRGLHEAPPRVAVDDIHAGLIGKKNRFGGMNLGLS